MSTFVVATEEDRTTQRMSTHLDPYLASAAVPPLVFNHQLSHQTILAQLPAELFVYVGHGEFDALVQRSPARELVAATDLPSTRITVAIACRSAQSMGPLAVALGAGAYVGWSEWWISYDPSAAHADPISGAISHFLLDLEGGETVGTASMRLRTDLMMAVMHYLGGAGSADIDAPLGAMAALWNAHYLTVLGDMSTTI